MAELILTRWMPMTVRRWSATSSAPIKINIFGPNQDQVAQTLGGGLGSGQTGDLIKKLLPILAPIVLAYLSKRFMGQSQGSGGGQNPLDSILSGGTSGSSKPLNDMLNSNARRW